MYDVWLVAIDYAIRGGARTSAAMMSGVSQMRSDTTIPTSEPETWRRQILALEDFWQDVDRLMDRFPTEPLWPKDFNDAMRYIGASVEESWATAGGIAQQVAAAISVCVWTAALLEYEHLARATPDLRVLTPGAKRAIDGNLSTGWYVQKGGSITLEYGESALATSLWLTNGCLFDTGSRIAEVEITADQSGEKWLETRQLDTGTAYFQRILLGKPPGHKLMVRITKTTGASPVCIAEIRIDRQ
jgi:hypothetical protein